MAKLGRNDRCTICDSGLKYKKCCGEYKDMGYKNICLLVGNGFIIDLIRSMELGDIDSSKPLSNFCCDEIDYSGFIDIMPDIRDGLLSIRENYANDFEAIDYFISTYARKLNQGFHFDELAYCNIRRFLALAYSQFYLELLSRIDKRKFENWKWNQWINGYGKNLSVCISFNYDLFLEKLLHESGFRYGRIGTIEDDIPDSISILKPHGSIDFDMKSGIGGQWDCTTAFRGNQVRHLGDRYAQLNVLPETAWLSCRMQADIIPPLQNNDNAELDWVQEIGRYFRNIASDIDAFIISGFSYSSADRPEVNAFIDACSGHGPIDFFIVNPARDSDDINQLIQYIQGQGHNVVQKDYLPWC